jgi:hypothetical protein
MTDSELIDTILAGQPWIVNQVFNDTREFVINWIFNNANITNGYIFNVNIRDIINTIIQYRQFVALDIVYRECVAHDILFRYDFRQFRILASDNTKIIIKFMEYMYDILGIKQILLYDDTLDRFITGGNIPLLKWFYHKLSLNGLAFNYCKIRIEENPIEVLNWLWGLYTNGEIKFEYDDMIFDRVCGSDLMDVLNWFYDRRNQIQFKHSSVFIDTLQSRHIIDIVMSVLNWFAVRRNEIKLNYSSMCTSTISIPVLDFWWGLRNELEFKYDEYGISFCISYDSASGMQWWYDRSNEIQFKYHRNSIRHLGPKCRAWWEDHMNEFVLELGLYDAAYMTSQLATWCLDNFDKFKITNDEDKIKKSLRGLLH